MRRSMLAVPLTAALLNLAPAVTTFAPARRRLLPDLSGIRSAPTIALTYDDGPDPASTPAFLDLLQRHDRRATFFLLGAYVADNTDLVREMAARGHELAVHGWDHVTVARKRPGVLAEQLRRAAEVVALAAGVEPAYYRPPYGVLTTESLYAARAAGLHTVLWSSWGVDWAARATPAGITRRVQRTARPGGTVLLHDTDRTSAPGSWRRTLAASEELLRRWDADGIEAVPLREHGIGFGASTPTG